MSAAAETQVTPEVRPLAPGIGAEITRIDVTAGSETGGLDEQAFDLLHRTWLERGVLLLRGQHLDEPALVEFSRRFGELEAPPAGEKRTRAEGGGAAMPEVWIISNVVENGEPIGALGAGEAEWHTDMAYIERPPTASILFAREVPPAGGDTYWAGMTAAWDALPDDLRAAISGRRIKHDTAYTSAGTLRKGAQPVTDPLTSPGVWHPAVRTHPETGAPALFLGRRRNAVIEGLDLAESDALMDRLLAFATQDRFVYRHAWRPGDLLIWDNRSTMHRRDAFDGAARRVMLRTQVRGTDMPH